VEGVTIIITSAPSKAVRIEEVRSAPSEAFHAPSKSTPPYQRTALRCSSVLL
jgi:hypothetical protein